MGYQLILAFYLIIRFRLSMFVNEHILEGFGFFPYKSALSFVLQVKFMQMLGISLFSDFMKMS